MDIPGYEDLVEIGRGGFAVVYRAHQAAFGRPVAIKVLTTPGLADVDRARFAREALAMGQLSWHPNIVVVHDAGVTQDGLPYLVMEYLEGGSLGDRLEGTGPLDPVEAVDHLVRLCAAVHTAHEADLLHRDVKPDNALLDAFGRVKLADFGIAAVTGSKLTATGMVTATFAHAAPEVMNGERATSAADVYALGSTLFELLAGAPAFVRATDESIVPLVMRASTDPVPDLRAQGVPDAVARIVEWAMAKDPAGRPPSALELGRALQAAQQAAGTAVTDLPVRTGARPSRADQATRTITHPTPAPSPPPSSSAPSPPSPPPPSAVAAPPAPPSAAVAPPTRPPAPPPAAGALPIPPPPPPQATPPMGAPQPVALPAPAPSPGIDVRPLVERAVGLYAGTVHEARLRAVLDRLDAPLRVAIAGKVKAGKSTLLNALVGEALAPTDEGECTQIVTWYRDGMTYRVTLDPREGESRQVPFTRDEGAIDVDLQGTPAEAVERLVVDWPSSSLKRITLIDTPGIGSLSTDVSARTEDFLTPDDDRPPDADAVLYLMKHLHASDANFLEAFRDDEVGQPTPVNAIAVLSRADEVGVGRLDSMTSARTIAARLRDDPKVRTLAQTVVAVAGLLAETGSTLREVEFAALRTLASAPAEDTDKLLLSVDRFAHAPSHAGLTEFEREALLDRFGVFGIRLSIQLIRSGQVTTASELAAALVTASGLPELRAALLSQFADRRDVLVARSALTTIEAAVHDRPVEGSDALVADIERLVASTHDFDELRLLNSLRTGAVTAKPDDVTAMERLLGTEGGTVQARLGLPAGADRAQVAQAAQAAMARWQRKAESPLSSPEMVAAARVLVRGCERILTDL